MHVVETLGACALVGVSRPDYVGKISYKESGHRFGWFMRWCTIALNSQTYATCVAHGECIRMCRMYALKLATVSSAVGYECVQTGLLCQLCSNLNGLLQKLHRTDNLRSFGDSALVYRLSWTILFLCLSVMFLRSRQFTEIETRMMISFILWSSGS